MNHKMRIIIQKAIYHQVNPCLIANLTITMEVKNHKSPWVLIYQRKVLQKKVLQCQGLLFKLEEDWLARGGMMFSRVMLMQTASLLLSSVWKHKNKSQNTIWVNLVMKYQTLSSYIISVVNLFVMGHISGRKKRLKTGNHILPTTT